MTGILVLFSSQSYLGGLYEKLLILLTMFLSFIIISCDSDKDENNNSDIPPDPSGVTVPAPTKNNVQPTATFNPVGSRIQINLLGLIDPSTNQPLAVAYNVSSPQSSTIFVEEDGKVKGLKSYKSRFWNCIESRYIVFSR